MESPSNFRELVNVFINLINPLLVLFAGLATVSFFWGLARFILRLDGDAKAVEQGKELMKWGLIALFVMVSFLGIINLFYQDFGFNDVWSFGIPFLPESKSL